MIEPSMQNLMQYLSSLRKPEPSMMPPMQQPNPMELLAAQAQQPQQGMMLANALQDRINQINRETAEPVYAPPSGVVGAQPSQTAVSDYATDVARIDALIRAQEAAKRPAAETPKIKVLGTVKVMDKNNTPVEGFKAADGWIYDSDPNDSYAERIKRWR